MRWILVLALLLSACGTSLRRFPHAEPMREDPDKQPFAPTPEKYFSPFIWDGADNLVFRPVANFFAVDPAGKAVNVNALDEVPASSWFTPRLGARELTLEEIAAGPCNGAPPIDPAGPWSVTGGKPDGENPGFFIKSKEGQRYLLKFDGLAQQPRATAADTIGTRIYWAAGFETPCNRIVEFDKGILQLAADAKAEKSNGKSEPMTQAMIDSALERAMRLPDGRYRGNASLYLSGKPLGPWRYEGTRDDDPNDVVRHEDRRELRGASVLASWVNHFDSREQNTLDMWKEGEDKLGYIQHHYIDFGDCFGSLWEWDSLSRRWGPSNVFHPGHILADFITLGTIVRPWDVAKKGKSGEVFGYFDVTPFDPEAWYNEYPNMAFGRMQVEDAHWMARILAHFDDAKLDAVIAAGHLEESVLEPELRRILRGRRDAILHAWLPQRSALASPQIDVRGDHAEVCVRDLLVDGKVVKAEERRYAAQAWLGRGLAPQTPVVRHNDKDEVCVTLPSVATASAEQPSYLIVDLVARTLGKDWPVLPLRLHFYQRGDAGRGGDHMLVGLERPDDLDPPSD